MVLAQSTMNRFPSPNENLTDTGDKKYRDIVQQDRLDLVKRWNEPAGQDLLHTLLSNKFDRAVLSTKVGRIYGNYDLRGIPLSGMRLSGVDLSECDLFSADLHGADLSRSNLKESKLSEADIRGTRFDWCEMTGAYLDNVSYDRETSFAGVNLEAINFTLAALLRQEALSQQLILDLESRLPRLAAVLRITSDYGRSFGRFALWCVGIVLFFALLFELAPQSTTAQNFGERLFFSIITFTTLGFGPIQPASAWGQVLVVLEVICGFFMMGLLIAILSRKVIY